MTVIDCVSDLHGCYPELPGGDILIVGGDLTTDDGENQYALFDYWLHEQNYKKKIIIAGNHDNYLFNCAKQSVKPLFHGFFSCEYLCDSGTEFEDLKIWGSPWTLWFPGINPHCTAFTGDEDFLAEKWKLIPEDTDILITHSPPYGLADKTRRAERVGSKSLHMASLALTNLKLWVVGHIHESYGIEPPGHLYNCTLLNASYMDGCYEPSNAPIRILLPP